jgi:creatinine amidohydrolase
VKQSQKWIMTGILIIGICLISPVHAGDNPVFQETRIKNYLPHLSWAEVKQALLTIDTVIIPVGAIEQHGPHLPLGTDFYTALKTCQLIGQKTDALVAPALMLGLSEYHMGFPGTMTLTPETFESVIYQSASSLIRHGFKKIIIYNGHGGNTVSLNHVIRKINQTTSASAILLNGLQLPPVKEQARYPEYDWHAGEMETSEMLYLLPDLVNMSRAEKPVLTFPPGIQSLAELAARQHKFQDVAMSGLFCPEETGKKASTRELTSNGVVTTGHPKNATKARGKAEIDRFVEAAVRFITDWKQIK